MELQKELIPSIESLAQQIVAAQPGLEEENDLRSLEVALWALVRQVFTVMVLVVMAIKRQRIESEAQPKHCGRRMRYRGQEGRCVSLAYGGDIEWVRGVWECGRCKLTRAPVDEALGVGRDSWSPLWRQFLCFGAALLPGGRAADLLSRLLGRPTARRTLMDVAEKEGATEAAKEAAQGALAQPYKPDKRQRWYVMLDGSASHVDGKWHEAQLGVVFPEDARVSGPRRKGKPSRYRLRWKRLFGCIRNWEAFGEILTRVVERLRLREVASRIVVITDGAPALRQLIALVLPDALQILDWYHAVEHLWTCAKVLYGEGTDTARHWVNKYQQLLYRGQVLQVLRSLEHAKRHHSRKGAQRALVDLIRYYRNNVDRMAYDTYRQQGLLIGSGPVEGAHRHVHHQRFKLAGMRHWNRERANALLNLRLIYLNGDWDAYWCRPQSVFKEAA